MLGEQLAGRTAVLQVAAQQQGRRRFRVVVGEQHPYAQDTLHVTEGEPWNCCAISRAASPRSPGPRTSTADLAFWVRAAAAAGEHTSRAQLLAALVAAVETTPERLADLLHHYRRLPADALTKDGIHDDLPTIRTPGRCRTKP